MGTIIRTIIIFLFLSNLSLAQSNIDTTIYLYPVAWVSNSENELCENSYKAYNLNSMLESKLNSDSIPFISFRSFQAYYNRLDSVESSMSILPMLSCDRNFYTLKIYLIANMNINKKASLIHEYFGDLNNLEISFEKMNKTQMTFSTFESVNNLMKKYENEQVLINSTGKVVSQVVELKKYNAKVFPEDIFKLLSDYYKYSDFKALTILLKDFDDIDKVKDKGKRKRIKKINKCYPNVIRFLKVVENYEKYKAQGNISERKTIILRDTLEHFSEMKFLPTKEETKNIFYSSEFDYFMRNLLEKVSINVGCQNTYNAAVELDKEGFIYKAKALYQTLLRIDEKGHSDCSDLKKKADRALKKLEDVEREIHISRLDKTDTLIIKNEYDEARKVVDTIKVYNDFSGYPDKLLWNIQEEEKEYLKKINDLIDNSFIETTNWKIEEIATKYLKELDKDDNIIVRIFSEPELTKSLFFQNKYGKGQYRTLQDKAVTDRVAKFIIDIYKISKGNKEKIILNYTGGSDNLGFIRGMFIPQEPKYKKLKTKVCQCVSYTSEDKKCYSFQKLLKGSAGTKNFSTKKRKLKFENNLALAFLRVYRRNDLLRQKIEDIVPRQFYEVNYCSIVSDQESTNKRFSNLTIVIPKSFYSYIIKLQED